MKKYKDLYKWMIGAMVIMQVGIFYDYWGDFSDNAWSIHIHYWSGTLWYMFLIFQPYFATHGQLEKHRTYGIIGMFVAGGVGIGGLNMMYRDIRLAPIAMENPERFGPFHPWFFYGIATVEIVMMTAFIYAVLKSIIYRKNLENHAWWLVSTVFIIMMPALSRGILVIQFAISGFSAEVNNMLGIYLANFIIILLILVTAIKYKQIKHPATLLAVGVNLFNFLLEPLGRLEVIQSFLDAVIKG